MRELLPGHAKNVPYDAVKDLGLFATDMPMIKDARFRYLAFAWRADLMSPRLPADDDGCYSFDMGRDDETAGFNAENYQLCECSCTSGGIETGVLAREPYWWDARESSTAFSNADWYDIIIYIFKHFSATHISARRGVIYFNGLLQPVKKLVSPLQNYGAKMPSPQLPSYTFIMPAFEA